MRTRGWLDVKAKGRSAEHLARLDAEVDAELLTLNLRAIRISAGKTQEELAATLNLSQAELSRFENRGDHLLSTLRRYVEALGGTLEVSAVFGEKKVKIEGA